MKYIISLLVLISFVHCKPGTTSDQNEIASSNEDVNSTDLELAKIPSELVKVFDHHGGIERWNQMKSMQYEIKNEKGNEKQVIDLKDRRERIDGSDFIMGFDGKQHWLEADTSYKGNVFFYKNLMFYFYAMPFVLADPGIVYTEMEPLVFEGKSYPGFRISYESEIGLSPEDEYFIHFDKETHQMAWLGYTVTYYSKEKSTKIKWISYDDWKKVEGLLLPSTLAWFKNENNFPIELRNRKEFINVQVSESQLPDSAFSKTEAGSFIKE